MRERRAAIGAWAMATATLAGTGTFVIADFHGGVQNAVVGIEAVAAITGIAVVGAAIVSRFPRHALGWLLCVSPFSIGIGSLLGAYVDLGIHRWPYWRIADAFSDPAWIFGIGVPALFFGLLIPDGRLPSPRWRPVAAFCGTALTMMLATSLFRPSLGNGHGPNPIGFGFAATVNSLGGVVVVPLLLAGLTAATVRYRRSPAVERLQIKWIATSFAVVVFAEVADGLGSDLISGYGGMPDGVLFLLWSLIPASFAFAIFRYRLYEIDLLIRRTLVYATLIIVLGAAYLAVIAGLGAASRAIAQQSGTLAVTLSTLLVAAAFQPLRSRVQRAVDRRFFRARYDASWTLEVFAGRLRDEIDLDQVGSEITRVVHETLRPGHLSLWLRPESGSR